MRELASVNMAEFISQNYQGYNNKIAIISYKKIGFKDLKSNDAVLIKKKKNSNIYSYNVLRQFIKK